MSSAIQGSMARDLMQEYESFHISHDGEGDDIQALIIAHSAINHGPVDVDCVIGNPDIVHVSTTDKDQEMQARMQMTDNVFGRHVALHGAKSNSEVSEQYIQGILKQSISQKCLCLHTDSFKSLRELFQRAQPGQLKNVVILSYGSVNLSWAMPRVDKEKTEEEYRKFYDALATSGAKLVQVEAFPFLGKKNHITRENTPITHSILPYLDGPVGKSWVEVTVNSTARIRTKHATIVVKGICEAMKSAPKQELQELLRQMLQLAGYDLSDEDLQNPEQLLPHLNRSYNPEQHKLFSQLTQKLEALLTQDYKRSLSIFTSTSLEGQALIADQIPAILFSELVEKRENGILKDLLPVAFDGFNDRYARYAVQTTQTALYYLNTQEKLIQEKLKTDGSSKSEKELVAARLKYIDLCIASALLAHDAVFTTATKAELLAEQQEQLVALAKEVQTLGYDLPRSYHALMLAMT